MARWRPLFLLCSVALLHGCTPQPEGQTEDQKDPFFQQGLRLDKEKDYKGAVDAFEKALQNNPRNVLAHFNLGRLYEGDGPMNDPGIALYHYKKVIKLQPSEYPAEIALSRIKGCEQEIAKGVALVQADPQVMNELERLKEENRGLKRDIETLRALAANPPAVFTNPPPAPPPSGSR
ncbi:MAG TPA: hypothetical protein DCM86_04320, partial [Verrucomicrobiales bacterium]|nr:hypothetical protein [Verrucomicrobiales bacterium]